MKTFFRMALLGCGTPPRQHLNRWRGHDHLRVRRQSEQRTRLLRQRQGTRFFPPGPYQMTLGFDTVNGPFDVSVTDVPTIQAALIQAQRLNGFPGYTCVPLDGTNCIDFQITAPRRARPRGPVILYDVNHLLEFQTNPNFPTDEGNLIRILHNRGDVPGDGFDTDITVIGSYVGEFRNALDDDPGNRRTGLQLPVIAGGASARRGTGTRHAAPSRIRRGVVGETEKGVVDLIVVRYRHVNCTDGYATGPWNLHSSQLLFSLKTFNQRKVVRAIARSWDLSLDSVVPV